jgi:hypothetical protein
MRAISVRQPWAWLIVNGYKDVENRDWKRDLRGEVLIHASRMIDHSGYEFLYRELPELFAIVPKADVIERGGIVGKATITDCVTSHLSIWFRGRYGFLFDTDLSTPLPFKPCAGQLGFFIASYGELPKGEENA